MVKKFRLPGRALDRESLWVFQGKTNESYSFVNGSTKLK